MFKDFESEWRMFFIVLLIVLVLGGGGILLLKSLDRVQEHMPSTVDLPALPRAAQTYSTQEECEAKAGCTCGFVQCDYVPPGKTFEEVCGKDFKKGWQCILQQEDETADWQAYRNDEFGFEVKYPSSLTVRVDESSINFFDDDELLPPVFGIEIFKPNKIPSGETQEKFLQQVAEERLGESAILRIVGFRDGGLEVEASTFFFRHFFLYDADSRVAVEFFEGQDGFLISGEFNQILSTFRFVE